MKILPLASDSMGTRSMATLIRTEDINILIDPSVALGPIRYGLPPHALEQEKKALHWQLIKKNAGESQIIIITHYHFDHFNPHDTEIFRNKKGF